MSTNKDLATALSVTDSLLSTASMGDTVEALRIACLMLAEHQRTQGEIPMERIFTALETEEIDEDTEELLLMGFQNLAGVLGSVMHGNIDNSPVH
ncbi:MAG: hypothetical protein HOE61_12640 [Candidatus Marinimicrobia bacterium]|jgi:hypothetical protein|nr:hypothetical protein [Candidatus Neomarinimicrobiota bacterium]MBT7913254.1 hypothetical protein [Candidatus Bathyarchaeota archaeon]